MIQNRVACPIGQSEVICAVVSGELVYCIDYISLNDLPEFPSAALVFAPLRSVLNVCHWHTAPSVNDATAEPAPAKGGYRLPLPPCRLKIHAR